VGISPVEMTRCSRVYLYMYVYIVYIQYVYIHSMYLCICIQCIGSLTVYVCILYTFIQFIPSQYR